MAEDRGFAEGAFQFFAKVGATYRWLRRRVGAVLAVLVLVVGAVGLVWWNWNDVISRPGVDRAVQWFQPETFPVPVLGQLNVAVTSFEGDTADQQRRRVILDELRKIPGVAVLAVPSPVGTADAIQSAAVEWTEHFEASVYIGGKVRDMHGRKLVDLIWFAPAPPQEHWTTIDHLIRDEVTVLPGTSPAHIKVLLPLMIQARMIDARDTLDEEFRKQNDDEQFEAAARTVESEAVQWSEPTRRAARGVVAQAYAAHREGLHSKFLKKAVELYAQLDREEPNTLWGERMADSLQRLGTFASDRHREQRLSRVSFRKSEQELRNSNNNRNGLSFFDRSSWPQPKPDRIDHCMQVAELGMGPFWMPSTWMQTPSAPPAPTDLYGKPVEPPPGPSRMLQESVESFSQALSAYQPIRLWSRPPNRVSLGLSTEASTLWPRPLLPGGTKSPEANEQETAAANALLDAALTKLQDAVETDLARLQAASNPNRASNSIFKLANHQEERKVTRAERRMSELAAILGECEGDFTNQQPRYLGLINFKWSNEPSVANDRQNSPSPFGPSREERKRRAAAVIVEDLRGEIGLQQLEAAIDAYRRALAANVTHPAASDIAITQNNLAVALQASRSGGAQELYLAAYNDLSARPDRRATIVKRSLDRMGTPTEP